MPGKNIPNNKGNMPRNSVQYGNGFQKVVMPKGMKVGADSGTNNKTGNRGMDKGTGPAVGTVK